MTSARAFDAAERLEADQLFRECLNSVCIGIALALVNSNIAGHPSSRRIDALSDEIMTLARQDKGCERLMTVPGIGPIISSAMVAAIGSGDAFSKGRDFGAWLGLVPKQMSTGDRTILGSISKRGNRYLRTLFVQAAWVVLVKVGPKHWQRYGLKSWEIETASALPR